MQLENPYEHQHRLLKSVRIVDALEEIGISLRDAKLFDSKQRMSVATHVESGPPSNETWEMVCSLYEKRVTAPFL